MSVSGDVATITATFDGKSTRQLWITPCVESPGPNGHEDRNVSGTLTMTLKQIPFRNVEVSFGTVSNVGEVSDPNHDSNRFAVEAAKNALLSGVYAG